MIPIYKDNNDVRYRIQRWQGLFRAYEKRPGLGWRILGNMLPKCTREEAQAVLDHMAKSNGWEAVDR